MTRENHGNRPSVRRLGILGGMSWASTSKYYDIINRDIIRMTNSARAADLVLWSFDTTEIEPLIETDNWRRIGEMLQHAADRLVGCDVDALLIASNTIHRVVEQSLLSVEVPFLHIRDALLEEMLCVKGRRVGFLGTSATMRGSVYRNIVSGDRPVDVILPPEKTWKQLDDAIFGRLCRGVVADRDVALMSSLLEAFVDQGADAVVLGCTELSMLCHDTHDLKILDTTALHAGYAARWSAQDFLKTSVRNEKVAT